MYKKICDLQKCTGCESCANICPTNAIEFVTSESDGFLVPKIYDEKCINCQACIRICPTNTTKKFHYPIKILAGISKDNIELLHSSSGGAFHAIASYFLENNGYVVGCAWDDKMTPCHIIIDKKEDLIKLQKSKYVQSRIGDIYSQVKKLLELGKNILFSGTPCQIAGLQSYLSKEYQSLICLDIICHGIPSQNYFSDYIKLIEKIRKGKITNYDFRYKEHEYEGRYGSYCVNNKKVVFNYEVDMFYSQFMKGTIYRNSCYDCVYSQNKRVGDITLGDFWGAEKFVTQNIAKGVSLIMFNTEKGLLYKNTIQNKLLLWDSDISTAIKNNAQLDHSIICPSERNEIINMWKEKGIKEVYKKFNKDNRVIILRRYIVDCVPKVLRKIIRSIQNR